LSGQRVGHERGAIVMCGEPIGINKLAGQADTERRARRKLSAADTSSGCRCCQAA